MNELNVINKDGVLITDSREVATVLKIEHKELLRKIEGTNNKKYIGYIPTLSKGNIPTSEFFIKDSYIDSTGRTAKCYLLTRRGCDLVANKITGEKGILFTATYVIKFEQMEEQLKQSKFNLPQTYKEALLALIQAEDEKEKLQLTIVSQEPKVDYYEKVLQAPKLATFTDIAKDIGWSARKLNTILHDLGVVYKQSNIWKPYKEYEWLVVDNYLDYHITEYSQTLKATEKGREWILNLLKQNKFI